MGKWNQYHLQYWTLQIDRHRCYSVDWADKFYGIHKIDGRLAGERFEVIYFIMLGMLDSNPK